MTDSAQHVRDDSERPSNACLLCPPPRNVGRWRLADSGYKTCSSCLDRIRDVLKDILVRYAKLNAAPASGADLGGRGAPGFGSRSPASEHVIAMRDTRSSSTAHTWRANDGKTHQESERPPLSVYGVLDTIAWDIAENRGIDGPQAPRKRGHSIAEVRQCRVVWEDGRPGPDTYRPPHMLAVLVRFIDSQLDWATRQDSIGELAAALYRVQSQLKPVTGDQRRKVGTCPNTITVEDDTTRECGAPLFAPTQLAYDDTVRCRACGRTWERMEWLHLADMLESA